MSKTTDDIVKRLDAITGPVKPRTKAQTAAEQLAAKIAGASMPGGRAEVWRQARREGSRHLPAFSGPKPQRRRSWCLQ
jgi:hypothetical protein